MKRFLQSLLAIPLLAFGSLLASCTTTEAPSVPSQRYVGHVVFGAPYFDFVPLGTRDHWTIDGTKGSIRQLYGYLDSQPKHPDSYSDSGDSVSAYVELVGSRYEVQPWYETDRHDVRLKVERILRLLPTRPGFIRALWTPL